MPMPTGWRAAGGNDAMTAPRFVFRTDASLAIGTGHVMRCLTLADALQQAGAQCRFICRDLPGHMADRIAARGLDATLLPAPDGPAPAGPPDHAEWAGVTWERDAAETAARLVPAPDWLVMDHYAFDRRWQDAARPAGTKLLVLDDLADRPHAADLLLDQNFGRQAADYDGLLPAGTKVIAGPNFALLRPEFAQARDATLTARHSRPMRHLLIAMGGIDLPDVSSRVLAALPDAGLPDDLRITVVMGAAAPALNRVRAAAATLSWPCEVAVNVTDMARLMADADLAIGAVGGTTWERCALGLPTLMVVIADNQAAAAAALDRAGAAILVGREDDPAMIPALQVALARMAADAPRRALADRTAQICDGGGTRRLVTALMPPA